MSNTLDIKECLGELYDNVEYRKLFFTEYGYNNDALVDPATSIRLAAYRKLRFTPAAFSDQSNVIRLEAYRTIGFTVDAFKDSCPIIRREAYESLGYTENAVNDECQTIAHAARAAIVKQRAADAKHKAQQVNAGTDDDFRYVLKFEDGYLADKQDDYDEYKFTNELKKSRMYKTIDGALRTGCDMSSENLFEIITLRVEQKFTIV